MHKRERTRSNSIMLEDIKSALFVRLVNVAIYVLHLVAHTTLHPPDTLALTSQRARASYHSPCHSHVDHQPRQSNPVLR